MKTCARGKGTRKKPIIKIFTVTKAMLVLFLSFKIKRALIWPEMCEKFVREGIKDAQHWRCNKIMMRIIIPATSMKLLFHFLIISPLLLPFPD